MSGYSVDLRERIVAASVAGHTQAWIATTFQVSVSSIKRYLTRQRQTGSVAATRPVHPTGQLHDGWREALEAMVRDDNSRTLVEYCEEWESRTGMAVSAPTLCRAFARFGITRKKDRWSVGAE